MKNFIILGLTALLLFSISAALSMWLNQGRYASETSPSTEKTKKTSEKEKEAPEPRGKSEHKTETGLGGADTASLQALKSREARLERRGEEINIIMKDILSERDALDNLIRQIALELRTAEGKVSDLEVRAAELEKKKIEFDAAERKNIERIASLLDAMAPESAASTLKQMADSGKLDVAAKVLALMKERNAARVMAELDPVLSAQLVDRIRLLKAASVMPRPGGAVPPTVIPKSP